MSAKIAELTRQRMAEDLEKRSQIARERTGILALLTAFDIARKAVEEGSDCDARRARYDFISIRAEMKKLVGEMYATPTRHLLVGFIEFSHVWTDLGRTSGLDRAEACVLMEGGAAPLRRLVGGE